MIISFSVSNFGSIKEKQTISFEATKLKHLEDPYVIHAPNGLRLLKLGLVYGANASGKTTLIKSLQFLKELVVQPSMYKTEELKFEPFLFDKNTPNNSSTLAIEFIQGEIRYFYEVEFNREAVLKETLNFYDPHKANVFTRTTDINTEVAQITIGSKIKKDKTAVRTLESNTLWNNTVFGGFIKTNIDFPELKEASDWFSYHLSDLMDTNFKLDNYVTHMIESNNINKSILIQVLKQADFNISDINIYKNIPKEFAYLPNEVKEDKAIWIDNIFRKVVFEHTVNGSKYNLKLDQESEGTQRYYGLAGLLAILLSEQHILAIDELERSIHPDLFTHFLLSFLVNSKSSQILATTHNREILNNKDLFRTDVIWITEKNDQCATELYSLADFDTSVIRDTSNILNAYKTGKLGGVPQLGDYYIDPDNE